MSEGQNTPENPQVIELKKVRAHYGNALDLIINSHFHGSDYEKVYKTVEFFKGIYNQISKDIEAKSVVA